MAVLIAAPERANRRDVVLEWQDDANQRMRLQRITELNPAYDPLSYPLLFPRGEDGWRTDIPRTDPTTGLPHVNPATGEPAGGSRHKVTQREFYAYRMMIRNNSQNMLHRARKLYSQFQVDTYAKVS